MPVWKMFYCLLKDSAAERVDRKILGMSEESVGNGFRWVRLDDTLDISA